MRVNLIGQSSVSNAPGKSPIPLTLTIRPACGVPGDYCYATDSSALLKMLRRETDLPASVIGNFEAKLYDRTESRLLGVELNDRTLTEIGYFVD
ncbi:MAG TPA: hypothetical protein VJU82_09065 [Acidobacteriaceae bacterium]|nr:hypothetical protein [Acidobacteriaceae bacterium]